MKQMQETGHGDDYDICLQAHTLQIMEEVLLNLINEDDSPL